MKKISSTNKALLGIVVLALVVVAFKNSSTEQSDSGRGGILTVTQVSAKSVNIESDRFYCASCFARMESDFEGKAGIQSMNIVQGNNNLGALNITYDQSILDIDTLADIGKRSLESDVYNKDPVTVVLK